MSTSHPHRLPAQAPDLPSSDSWLSAAVEAGQVASFDYDLESGRLRSTRLYRKLFGLPERDGTTWEDVLRCIHPDDRARVLREREEAIRERRGARIEYRVARPDGSWRWLCSIARVVADPEGRMHLAGVEMDVTDRRLAEQALRDGARRKDDFLATLAHELRNRLAPIANSLEVLDRSADSDAAGRARATIARQVDYMVRLTDDLFDVIRIGQGKLQLKPARVDLGGVVAEAIESCRPLFDRARQTLTVEKAPDPLYVDADPVRLTQIFGNLLNNASRYTEAGGRVRIELSREGGSGVVRVRDSGVGIPPEMLPRIFEMFTQVERPAAGNPPGLGVGLTLVRRLVEMHGGTVTAESDGPGAGCTFTVRLPEAIGRRRRPRPAVKHAAAAADPQPVPAARRRVLVVDDNPDGAASLTDLLRLTGHDAETAHDGAEAIQKAAEYGPEIILLDIALPKLDGLEVCRRVREQPGGRDIAIVAVTGWGQEADRQRTREAGFSAHLVKPVRYSDLLDLLATLDAGRQPSKEHTPSE